MEKLQDWIEKEVNPNKAKGMRYLSTMYFHRHESRSNYIDSSYMYSPADGTILGAFENIKATESIIQVKGVNFSLRDLLQDDNLKGKFLVVSIFMSFYDQHLNYIPFSGNRTYVEIDALTTLNKPMIKVEQDLLNGIINPEFQEEYLRKNSREISEIFSPNLLQKYMICRVGDYDVDTMVNFKQPTGEEAMAYIQNECFGNIIYGSQCILIVPQLGKDFCQFKLRKGVEVGMHVKCKYDALVEVIYP